ncbi:phenylalanine--tRNA ligase subunit beta [Thermosulfurimonas sp. F29]|uniref:phenylalanine--tRNA ligase subunit beta n=1 Tax=Thermosulfurimonas sp. F29 TaxID=2867247 RepID=UPI001C8309FB|nr:phenylalanine--tRNA ligase subunit beta [Thermosulfurimonas sp. F29]MBX6423564.1 phenylalanine--tRNA ligase subunit beta [Thermosulfurimonas sp. F29]
MRVPWSWLREFVEVDLSPEEVAELLTLGGLEVEGVEEAYEALGPVVVAEILSVTPHPEAENLKICEVTHGRERFEVVSGAPGLEKGLKVALALPGAVTFSGERIREVRIRGVLSRGMILSPYEAGVAGDRDRVLVLPPEAEPGEPFYRALALSEPVLEVAVTPNRGDCLSVLGVAREVAALCETEVHLPDPPDLPEGEDILREARVEILEPDLCGRYAGRLIRGVSVRESPFEMARRLWMCGLRPINNLVDVTNYVMLELGQPLHAFDWSKIRGRRIVVRRARDGERLRTLDGEERELSRDILVIADEEGAVAVAGVMGGAESGIGEGTGEVFLEAAWFNPSSIRRTARGLRLSTESSYRFERGVDPEGVPLALDRAAALVLETAGGAPVPGRIDVYPRPHRPPRITLRLSRLEGYLRVEMASEEVARVLERTGGRVEGRGEVLTYEPPSFRHDLSLEEDLIEEVARLYGYDRLPVSLPVGELSAEAPHREDTFVERTREVLRALGFYEVINYSFISPEALAALELSGEDPRARPLRLANPLSETQSVMRTLLLPGLLETARFNYFREIDRLKVFEVGRVFLPRGGELPEERLHLGFLIMGEATPEFWGDKGRPADVYDLKGVLERLLCEWRLEGVELTPGSGEPFLKRGLSLSLAARGRTVGFAGALKTYLRARFELPEPVWVAEVDLSALLELPESPRVYRGLPRFPATVRDLTMVVREDLPAGEVLRFVREMGIPYLERVEVVDVYRGDPIPPGEKSVTFRFVYRSAERTLEDREVNAVQEEAVRRILETFKARPR